MFERYTEHARRVIFFARYQASEFGSSEILIEDLLLGLLRGDEGLIQQLTRASSNLIRDHRHIGTEHLFLGILREENSATVQVLRQNGVTLEFVRELCSRVKPQISSAEIGYLSSLHCDVIEKLPKEPGDQISC